MKRFNIPHVDGLVTVREFNYEGSDGSFAAGIWVSNDNRHREADAVLSRPQVVDLINALREVIRHDR